jgi:hypothetical protein
LIQGEQGSDVVLVIKNQYNKKETYTIKRDYVSIPEKKASDYKFDVHWKQVAPDGAEDVKPIHPAISSKLSWQFMNIDVGNAMNYWGNRKIAFTKGYDACLTYPKNEQNACLMNLVNREIAKTNQDEQMQALRQQNYQLFRINNALLSF